jgi:arabinosaccharide transport system substrate-binding protein
MDKRRLVSIFVSLVVILTFCAGCTQSGTPTAEAPVDDTVTEEATEETVAEEPASEDATEESEAAEVTQLEIWSFVEDHLNFYDKMAGLWNEENPDRPIELVPTHLDWSSMHDKLYTALMAGEGVPDLSDVEISKWPQFMEGEVQFLDLTPYAEPYMDDLVQSRLDIYSQDGELYGAPSHIGAMVMYYNTELLEEAGIDYTTIKTWDDFEDALRTYHEATGNYMTYCETYGSYEFTLLIAEMGVDLIDENGMPQLDTEEAIRAVELIRKWVDEDLIGFIPTGNADTPEGQAAVANGDVAALAYPLWYMSRFTSYMENLSGKVAIAPVPVFDDTSYKSVGLGGTGTVVYKNSEHADLAAEFIAFAKLSETGGTYIWTDLGFDPINMKVWENLEVTQDPGNKFLSYFQTNPFDVLAEVQDGIFAVKTMQNSGIINDYLSATTWNRIYVSLEDPVTVLQETQAELMSQSSE